MDWDVRFEVRISGRQPETLSMTVQADDIEAAIRMAKKDLVIIMINRVRLVDPPPPPQP